MRTASFARHQRLFGQRDWPAGEPYRIGDRQFGIVTPEGAVEFNEAAIFTEPTGAYHSDTPALLDRASYTATLGGIVMLVFCLAALIAVLAGGY